MKLLSSRELILVFAVTSAAVIVLFIIESRGFLIKKSPESQEDYHHSRISYFKSSICQPRELESKCTVLMPTYRRVKMLPQVLDNYCNMSDSVQKIIVVWNDIEHPIPPLMSKLVEKCRVELTFIPMKENKLSNRFLPGNYSKEIETECK